MQWKWTIMSQDVEVLFFFISPKKFFQEECFLEFLPRNDIRLLRYIITLNEQYLKSYKYYHHTINTTVVATWLFSNIFVSVAKVKLNQTLRGFFVFPFVHVGIYLVMQCKYAKHESLSILYLYECNISLILARLYLLWWHFELEYHK